MTCCAAPGPSHGGMEAAGRGEGRSNRRRPRRDGTGRGEDAATATSKWGGN